MTGGNGSAESNTVGTVVGDDDAGIAVLLAEYERLGTTIRQSTDRQARLITNGIAAGGLVLAYAFLEPLAGSVIAVIAVPFIMVAVAILSIEEDVRKFDLKVHLGDLESELATLAEVDGGTFGWESRNVSAVGVTRHDPLAQFYAVVGSFYLFLVLGIVLVLPDLVNARPVWFEPNGIPVAFGAWNVLLLVIHAGLTVIVALAIRNHSEVRGP